MQKNMCKTYDVSILFKETEQGKQRHNNNFRLNLKQLPKVLGSSYSEKNLENHKKSCDRLVAVTL